MCPNLRGDNDIEIKSTTPKMHALKYTFLVISYFIHVDMAEKVFHLCTNANEHSPESQRFQITFNYELLDDQYTSWENDDGSSRQGEASSLQGM